MSTADGLVVSSARLLRMTFIAALSPRNSAPSEEALDHRVLMISRYSTVGVLLITMAMAWGLRDINVVDCMDWRWRHDGSTLGTTIIGALWQGLLGQVPMRASSEGSQPLLSCMPN